MPQRAWLGRLPFSAAWRNNWTAAARIRRHGHAALGHHAEQILRGRQAGVGRPAQFSRHLRLLLRLVRRARPATGHSRERPAGSRRRPTARTSDAPRPDRASSPVRRSGCSRAPPGRRPNRPRPPCAPIAQRRSRNPAAVAVGGWRTGLADGRRPGPALRASGPWIAQGGKLRLRLDVALVGRALQPARAFRPAGRHAGAFEIAAAHAVFGLGDAGPRGAGQQREGLLGIALLDQPHRPPQRGGGRERPSRRSRSAIAVSALAVRATAVGTGSRLAHPFRGDRQDAPQQVVAAPSACRP